MTNMTDMEFVAWLKGLVDGMDGVEPTTKVWRLITSNLPMQASAKNKQPARPAPIRRR